jgi:hypothetical protein
VNTPALKIVVLLNPAFCGCLVLRAAQGYIKESSSGLPFIYAYLILPFVLHPETRERLPHSIVTKLSSWAERNSELVTSFPRRTADLGPATRDGLLLVSTTGMATIGEAGKVESKLTERELSKFEKGAGSTEVAECFKKASFVGRWLATSGTVPTVLTTLGVRI